MAIEFKTLININGEHVNAIERGNIRASIWNDGKTLTTYGHLSVPDLEQILSKMKELQSEVAK